MSQQYSPPIEFKGVYTPATLGAAGYQFKTVKSNSMELAYASNAGSYIQQTSSALRVFGVGGQPVVLEVDGAVHAKKLEINGSAVATKSDLALLLDRCSNASFVSAMSGGFLGIIIAHVAISQFRAWRTRLWVERQKTVDESGPYRGRRE